MPQSIYSNFIAKLLRFRLFPIFLLALFSSLCFGFSQAAAQQLTGLSCANSTMVGTGTDLCTVSISAPAPSSGFRVALSSKNAAVNPGSTVLVQPNQTTAQFKSAVTPVSTAQVATLSASAGTVTKTFALQLNLAAPALSLGVSSVAFGTVPVATTATQTVVVTSSGTAPLVLSGATVSGSGFTLSPVAFPVTLNPGQKATLTVGFDPTAVGTMTGQLTIASNTSAASIPLNGTGAPQLTGLSCANSRIAGMGTDLCTVSISAPAPSSGFRVVLSSNNAAVSPGTMVLVEPNQTTAQFKSAVAPVSTAQVATLAASAGAVTETFALQLNLSVPALAFGVSSVAFGTVPVATTATQTVVVTSSGTAPLVLSGATISGSGFTLSPVAFPVTLNPGQTIQLTVAFNPTAVGTMTGQLTIASNTSAASIPLTGTGAPQLTGLTCANATMAGTGTDLCTVSISVPASSSGFRVALSSNNQAVNPGTMVLVQPNQTTAQFPAAVTPVSTVQVATLAASAGAVTETFALQLNLPVPALSFGVSSVAFGTVPVATTATQNVVVTSSGTAPLVLSGATVSGSGFTLSPITFPVTLNPGQTATLTVAFTPTQEAATTGQLIVSSNLSTGSSSIPLNGTGGTQLVGFSCANSTMAGTGTDLCTVSISEPAPSSGFRVALSSNNAAVNPGTMVLVQPNQTTAQFKAAVTPVSTVQVATLTASAGTVTETFALQLNLPVPALSFGVSSVAFGTVPVATTATQNVVVTSSGTAPLVLSGATVSGSGFTLSPITFPVTLNPGQTATLTVAFTPTQEAATTGQLIVSSNLSTGSSSIPLNGTGGTQLIGFSCASNSVTGAITDQCTVSISEPALSSGFRVALASNNAAVNPGTMVLVQPNQTTAQFPAVVTAVSTAQAATLTASAGNVTETFALQLNAAYPVLSTAGSMAFGNVAVNVPVTELLVLNSTGTVPLVISGASVTGTGFTLAPIAFPMTLNPGQSASLGVQFDPAAAGQASGQLTLSSNSSPVSTSVIALTGAGATSGTFSYSGSPIVSTIVPPNPSNPISADYFGMTIIHTATPFPAFPVSTLRFWDAAPWGTVEPTSGAFNWSHVDSEIATGQENGVVDYLYTFGDVPTWASTNPTAPCTGGDGAGTCAPPVMTAFDSFATALVQRYCGTIKYYETWNEPNNSPYWSGTNAQLLAVAQDLYQIAKDPANCGCTNGVCSPNGGVNPNQVLTPSISKVTSANLSWLDSYLSQTGPTYPYADVASFHGYGTVVNSDPEQIVSQVQSLNQILANHGLSTLPLWNTEASWGSLTSVDQDQASWLMRYQAAQAVTGVSRFVWYSYDNCGWGTLWVAPWCTGTTMPLSQPTAAGEAYPVIQNWLSGASIVNCQTYENGLWACELQRPGNYSAWMVWSSTGAEIDVPIPATSGLTIYRDWQNNVDSLSSSLTVGEMPVLLGNLNP